MSGRRKLALGLVCGFVCIVLVAAHRYWLHINLMAFAREEMEGMRWAIGLYIDRSGGHFPSSFGEMVRAGVVENCSGNRWIAKGSSTSIEGWSDSRFIAAFTPEDMVVQWGYVLDEGTNAPTTRCLIRHYLLGPEDDYVRMCSAALDSLMRKRIGRPSSTTPRATSPTTACTSSSTTPGTE